MRKAKKTRVFVFHAFYMRDDDAEHVPRPHAATHARSQSSPQLQLISLCLCVCVCLTGSSWLTFCPSPSPSPSQTQIKNVKDITRATSCSLDETDALMQLLIAQLIRNASNYATHSRLVACSDKRKGEEYRRNRGRTSRMRYTLIRLY